jgi:hypothetical protein
MVHLRRPQPDADLDGFNPDSLRRTIERARNAFARRGQNWP